MSDWVEVGVEFRVPVRDEWGGHGGSVVAARETCDGGERGGEGGGVGALEAADHGAFDDGGGGVAGLEDGDGVRGGPGGEAFVEVFGFAEAADEEYRLFFHQLVWWIRGEGDEL